MKSVAGTLLLGLAVALLAKSTGACAAPPRLDAVRIAGREYVRASQWAAARGFSTRWLRRDETMQLSRDSSTVVLKADGREAQINGVQVWLSYPVMLRNGSLFVSRLDWQTALEPILIPSRPTAGLKLRTICLDPGHGGRDPGNEVGSNQEKKYSLLLAQELRDQLTRAGFNVILTRTRDTYVELDWRPMSAKRRKADLFISLHFNSAESSRSSVRGCEVYCLAPPGASSTNARGERGPGEWSAGHRYSSQSMLLAYQLQKSLTQTLAVEDRGVRRARFAVLREAAMPAVLVEAGFMSHPAEGRKIFTAEYRRQIARAIAGGVTAFQRVVERPQ
ncbi:MAG TPA: N-acetylmuramoyl-L-alanine amidase [Verrucomicrobiae bacterium]